MEKINVPKCECGCGKRTTWHKRKKEWNKRLLGHYERTPEIRKKLSAFQKKNSFFLEYNKTKEHSEKVIRSNKNRIVTEEQKHKISESLKGRKRSPDEILKGRITSIDNESGRLQNNSNWKGGVSPRKDTGEWIKISREIKKRDNYTCQICSNTKNIDVHHVDLDKSNHEPLNLISICRKCHRRIHIKKLICEFKVVSVKGINKIKTFTIKEI